jgi:hypothetical protein
MKERPLIIIIIITTVPPLTPITPVHTAVPYPVYIVFCYSVVRFPELAVIRQLVPGGNPSFSEALNSFFSHAYLIETRRDGPHTTFPPIDLPRQEASTLVRTTTVPAPPDQASFPCSYFRTIQATVQLRSSHPFLSLS